MLPKMWLLETGIHNVGACPILYNRQYLPEVATEECRMPPTSRCCRWGCRFVVHQPCPWSGHTPLFGPRSTAAVLHQQLLLAHRCCSLPLSPVLPWHVLHFSTLSFWQTVCLQVQATYDCELVFNGTQAEIVDCWREFSCVVIHSLAVLVQEVICKVLLELTPQLQRICGHASCQDDGK